MSLIFLEVGCGFNVETLQGGDKVVATRNLEAIDDLESLGALYTPCESAILMMVFDKLARTDHCIHGYIAFLFM